MRRLFALIACCSTAAAAVPTSLPAQQNVAGGGEIYALTCGRCHNPRSPLERSDRDWTVITAHMRVRGNLTGPETRAVRAFLQAMNERDERGSEPAAGLPRSSLAPLSLQSEVDQGLAAEGAELVARYGCAACHRIGDASSGTLGPDLNSVLRRRAPEYVLRKLADPRFDTPNSMMPAFVGEERQRRAVLEYLRSLQR